MLRALIARLPAERFVYLGDTARLPYGTKSAETVQAYALQATRLLIDQGVKMLVIACNTASAVALYLLQEAWEPVPVIGVIEPGARAGAAATRNRHIAVIATEGTVKGGAYMRAIHRLMRDAVVVQQPCQVFVALAEEGWTDSPVTLAAADSYLKACSAASTRRTRSCSAARISRCSPPRSARASGTPSRLSTRQKRRRRLSPSRLPRGGSQARQRTRAGALLRDRFARTLRPRRRDLSWAPDRPSVGRARGPAGGIASLDPRRRLRIGQSCRVVGRIGRLEHRGRLSVSHDAELSEQAFQPGKPEQN